MASKSPSTKSSGSAGRRFSRKSKVDKLRLAAIRNNLQQVGADRYDLILPETKYLTRLLGADEKLLGAVYGHHKTGRGALFVSDRRVIFVDKKPLFVHFDEFSFMVIGAVTFTRSGLSGIVTVHTRGGDYMINTLNMKAAEKFVRVIEDSSLKHSAPEGNNDDPYN